MILMLKLNHTRQISNFCHLFFNAVFDIVFFFVYILFSNLHLALHKTIVKQNVSTLLNSNSLSSETVDASCAADTAETGTAAHGKHHHSLFSFLLAAVSEEESDKHQERRATADDDVHGAADAAAAARVVLAGCRGWLSYLCSSKTGNKSQ